MEAISSPAPAFPKAAPVFRAPAFLAILPGVALAAAIAAAAYAPRLLPAVGALSPMILAILLGVGLRNLFGVPAWAASGIVFSLRKILRFAIALLGLQLSAAQIIDVGFSGLAIIAATLVATFCFTTRLGRWLGVDAELAQLIAAGTSICGASAVVAANAITRARDEDVAYAIACVTVFGTLAMVSYPALADLARLGPRAYGLWAGASIHEVAQVIAASFQHGREAGDFGAVAKLSRVMLLAPTLLTLAFMAGRGARGEEKFSPPFPWFVIGFLALVGVSSIVAIPPDAKAAIATATTVLLSMALAAMGLETDITALRAKGLRPLALGLAASVFVSGFSLALIEAFFR
ncbi:putative integral membrane protein (TIGR00698 family) [Methylosinus sp. sav-2]|uniref:YeiH family protein n=1 Tax=Methylosinus sp. sav-2 TaxID=2485168 RepID=UPI000478E18C|nr:YeiH family protein [Methylosinus sp. sav-2]TDX67595.1 putative integral membrane protein (TIGR00698 family) [Methylosinus sp. sav-2]